jgi:DNA-binding response OmpR family regulator
MCHQSKPETIDVLEDNKAEFMQSRARVLIIDDDAMFRNLIMTHLRKDYVVSVATDGKDGYHKAKSHRPDVAIIDIQMPGWDGIQTLKAFKDNPSLKDVKTIMLTADATRETVMTAIRSGAQEYMIKSAFKKEELLAKVMKLATGHQFVTQSAATVTSNITSQEVTFQQSENDIQLKEDAIKDGLNIEIDDKVLVDAMDNWE